MATTRRRQRVDEPHETAPSNLPVLHNSFVGRTEELTRLVGLLDEAAIVTVVAGRAKGDLLDTYGAERAAVGRDVLAMTHKRKDIETYLAHVYGAERDLVR